MSYTSTLVQCETIQELLNSQFEVSTNPIEAIPALEAIIATQKANGISQSVSDGMGKVKTIKVVYDQRMLESSVTEATGSRTCTSSSTKVNNYATYTIDPETHLKADISFSIADLATVCTEDVQSLYAKYINQVIDVLERKIATKTATELVALYGKWGSNVQGVTSDELVLPAYSVTASKIIDYMSMPKLDMAFQLTGYSAPQIIVGGADLYQYSQAINAGCCQTSGVNVMEIANTYGKSVMFDKRVATALGSQAKSIAFQAGSVALITYNEASSIPNIGANYAKFKVSSPRTGLPIDIVVSDNCGDISIVAYANTKLVGLPTDMFAVGDEYRGVTFVNKIKIENPA